MGHSKSSKNDTIQSSIHNFLLTFTAISVENHQFFPPPVYLTPPLKGFPLELGIGARVRRN